MEKENIFVLDFYDLKNKNIEKIDKLQFYLFNKIIVNSNNAIINALKKESLTKVR